MTATGDSTGGATTMAEVLALRDRIATSRAVLRGDADHAGNMADIVDDVADELDRALAERQPRALVLAIDRAARLTFHDGPMARIPRPSDAFHAVVAVVVAAAPLSDGDRETGRPSLTTPRAQALLDTWDGSYPDGGSEG